MLALSLETYIEIFCCLTDKNGRAMTIPSGHTKHVKFLRGDILQVSHLLIVAGLNKLPSPMLIQWRSTDPLHRLLQLCVGGAQQIEFLYCIGMWLAQVRHKDDDQGEITLPFAHRCRSCANLHMQ